MLLPFLLCAAQDAPEVTRIRLFDHMDEANLSGLPEAPPAEDLEVRTRYGFEGPDDTPTLAFGRPQEGRMHWDETPPASSEGGRAGQGLALGPGVVEDFSRACFVLPAEGTCRVRVRARVRLENNEGVGDASSRECLRVVEHSRSRVDPADSTRARQRTSLRVSRRHDPSGWDILTGEFVTSSRTRWVEVQLLHRSGGSTETITRFDDVEVRVMPLDEARLLDHLSQRYRPDDGQALQTPWRLRVSLGGEVRDSMLLPAPASLSFPVTVPSGASRLRFQTGALPEIRQLPGDAARMEVLFRADGEDVELASLEVHPRRNRQHRNWMPVQVDLSSVAGRTGELVFRARDEDDEPDVDPLLLSTPRIEPTNSPPAGFNVLLIGVDTLRADHMSAFGYEEPTTPHLAALADDGVRFTQCRSQAPWTLPSFSTMLTSLYPSVHNAGRGGHDVWTPIDPTTVSIAEILSRVGYETEALVANFLISPRYGLDQGFESHRTTFGFESALVDVTSVKGFVDTHRDTPWFYFWHIMDPHLPYEVPEEMRAGFTDASYAGQFHREGRDPHVPFQVLDPRPGRRWFAHEGPPPAPELTEEDERFIVDYYDAELFEMDAAIGDLFQTLKDSGQWDRTIIAFVADHGEGLGDHGHYHHGYTLFDDQVHIPMLLRVPGKHSGRVIDRPVGSIDLAPTLLGALGLPIPEEFHGVDRLAEGAPTDDPLFLEYPTYDSSAQKAWVLGKYKYLHDPVFHTEALYDIEADPTEQKNIVGDHPEVVREARAALDRFRWERLQVGRFHLRVRGKKGAQLKLLVNTDDLFDANFATKPQVSEHDFTMDLERRNLVLETTLVEGGLELVFWGRGETLTFDVSLDGVPVQQLGYPSVDGDQETFSVPVGLTRSLIPAHLSESVPWPEPGNCVLWLEAGAREMLPVINTPEEIERLRALGYAR